ncbi:hypothetical protein K435DRAFT_704950, partial [Dendrothele bispora CBS 962.96]
PLERYFAEYTYGGNDINKAAKYILWKFMQANRARLSTCICCSSVGLCESCTILMSFFLRQLLKKQYYKMLSIVFPSFETSR